MFYAHFSDRVNDGVVGYFDLFSKVAQRLTLRDRSV